MRNHIFIRENGNTITAKKKGRPKKTVVPVQQDDPEIDELRGRFLEKIKTFDMYDAERRM